MAAARFSLPPRPDQAAELEEYERSHALQAEPPSRAQQAKEVAKKGAWAGWTTGKKGFDWLWKKSEPVGGWLNKQAGKLGIEAVWPTTLDKECDKAARILFTFTQRDGGSALPPALTVDPYASKKTQKMPLRIPQSVLNKAEGLAIFTVWRTGLGFSAASGSGIVIARDSPTTWGAPSGLLVHTVGMGFLAGMDVYDAVLVLRTRKAVEAFTRPKLSLGAEVSVAAGPVGNSAAFDVGRELAPVLVYSKSKGIYGGLQIDGNIIIERQDENARFYGHKVKARDILAGGAVALPRAASGLHAAIALAEGQRIDPADLPEDVNLAPSEAAAAGAAEAEGQTGSGLESRGGGGGGSGPASLRGGFPNEEEQDRDEEKLFRRRSAPPGAGGFTRSVPPRPPRRFVAPPPPPLSLPPHEGRRASGDSDGWRSAASEPVAAPDLVAGLAPGSGGGSGSGSGSGGVGWEPSNRSLLTHPEPIQIFEPDSPTRADKGKGKGLI